MIARLKSSAVIGAVLAVLAAAPGQAETGTPSRVDPQASLWTQLAELTGWFLGLFEREDKLSAEDLDRFRRGLEQDAEHFDQLVKECGYALSQITVGGGPAGLIGLSMDFERQLGEKEKAALLARLHDDQGVVGAVERTIVLALLDASESTYAAGAVRAGGFRLTGVEIDLDLSPVVTFILEKIPTPAGVSSGSERDQRPPLRTLP